MELIDLQPFESFIQERSLAPERNIQYYVSWVRRFLQAALPSAAVTPEDRLRAFLDQLGRDTRVLDWQLHQAARAGSGSESGVDNRIDTDTDSDPDPDFVRSRNAKAFRSKAGQGLFWRTHPALRAPLRRRGPGDWCSRNEFPSLACLAAVYPRRRKGGQGWVFLNAGSASFALQALRAMHGHWRANFM